MFFAKVAGLQLQCCALIGLSVLCEIVESIGMSALYHREEIEAVIEIKPRGVEGATFWCRNPLWIARFGVFFAGHTDTGVMRTIVSDSEGGREARACYGYALDARSVGRIIPKIIVAL